MIEHVDAILREAGLVDPGCRLRFNIQLTKGDALVIYAYSSPREFVHVKASEAVPLRAAYDAQAAAWRSLPDHVPRPLGFHAIDGWDFALTEGVDIPTIDSTVMRRIGAKMLGPLLTVLTEPIDSAARTHDTADVETLLHRLYASVDGTSLVSVLIPWLETSALTALKRLPAIPQHGDFVPNNLGWSEQRFIVFDWEDHGKVALPGFDLCTLICATYDFSLADILELMNGNSRRWYEELVRDYCARVGLEVSKFRRLVPLYLTAFLYLKGTYGRRVQEMVRAAIQGLVERGAASI